MSASEFNQRLNDVSYIMLSVDSIIMMCFKLFLFLHFIHSNVIDKLKTIIDYVNLFILKLLHIITRDMIYEHKIFTHRDYNI